MGLLHTYSMPVEIGYLPWHLKVPGYEDEVLPVLNNKVEGPFRQPLQNSGIFSQPLQGLEVKPVNCFQDGSLWKIIKDRGR